MKLKQYKTFVGADLHKNFTQFAAQNKAGKEIAHRKVDNDEELFRRFLAELPPPVHVAVESTLNWAWFCETIKQAGADVIVAHARDVRAKSGTREKSDRKDARLLATLLRGGLIEKEAYQAPEDVRRIRERLRHMHGLRKTIVANKNRISDMLIKRNVKVPFRDAFCKKGRLYLKQLALPEPSRMIVDRSLAQIEVVEGYFEEDLAYCRQLIEADPQTLRLTSIPGIGERLAPLIRYETGDVDRFERVEAYVNYTGLVPGKQASAGRSVDIGISKEGSFWLRWAFVQAAQTAGQQRGRLARFYWRHFQKSGKRGKAVVATAREIAVIAYHVMKRRQGYYEPWFAPKPNAQKAS